MGLTALLELPALNEAIMVDIHLFLFSPTGHRNNVMEDSIVTF